MKWLWKLLLDQRGIEGDASAGDASGDADQGDAGQGDAGADANNNDGQGDINGQSGDGTVPPKFGEFGDDPNVAAEKLFQAFQKTKGDFDNFKTKAGLTERNLGSLRKTLEGSGIRVIEDSDNPNGYRLEPIVKEQKKARFTEEHGKIFDKPVLEGIRLLVQDIFDEQYEGRERMTKEQQGRMQAFVAEKNEVESLLVDYFPQIDGKFKDGKATNPDFNQALYDRATEIWETEYRKNPLKQLSAAMRAAKELNIIPGMVKKAEIAGYQAGKNDKKILGPVVPKIGGKAVGGKWSKEQYLAATEEERIAYDKINNKL